MIHDHEFLSEEPAAEGAEGRAGDDDDEGEFDEVETDLAVGETEGLEDGDLFALERDLAAHDGVRHEGADAEEDQREAEGEALEDADFVGDAGVGRVVAATVGAETAVGFEDAVEAGDDGAFAGAGGEGEGDGVEGAFEVEGF